MRSLPNNVLLICLLSLLVSACAGTAPIPTNTPAPTVTSVPPTIQPQPTASPLPTATEKVLFAPPAARFLPALQDLPANYALGTSIISDNLMMMASIPLPKENIAAVTFSNQGGRKASTPQNEPYYQLSYWVILAPDETNAQLFYTMSTGKDYSKQAFLVIMPSMVFQSMGEIKNIPLDKAPCDEASILGTVSDPYAVYRSGQLPTQTALNKSMPGGVSPQQAADYPPDLYLYASCRVKNALILFWGHAPDNYDGKNAPIPDNVIAEQVAGFLQIATGKLK